MDGGLNQNISPKTYAAPSLTPMDFPALSISNSQGIPAQFGGDDLQQIGNHYQSPEKDNMFFFKSGPSVTQPGSIDYVSAVRKLASQDSGMWKYERNDSADSSIGSSRNSHASAGAYKSGRGRSIFSDKLQSRGQTRAAPVWVETGDAVGKFLLFNKLTQITISVLLYICIEHMLSYWTMLHFWLSFSWG